MVGQPVVVRGVQCRVTAVLPMGTIEVEAVDESGRCWRVSGLAFTGVGAPLEQD